MKIFFGDAQLEKAQSCASPTKTSRAAVDCLISGSRNM